MRIHLSVLLSALVSLLAGAETVVSSANGRLAVNFCREDLVHFRFAPQGTEFVPARTYVERQAVEKTDADFAPVSVREARRSEAVEIAGAKLKVTVDARTLAVTILADGRPVFRNGASAFAAKGEGRRASFARDVAGRERFFGLGNLPGHDFTSLDLRDRSFDLWLTANNVHAVVPLWYSSAGYGVYVCSSNRGRVSFTEDYALDLEGGELNFYFVWGPSFRRILAAWSELAGRMNMPPLYALGLTYRGCGGFNAKDLENIIREQQAAGVQVDVVGVEPGWHTRAYPCSFRWSERFPNPKGFIDTMHALGVKVNFWEHPYYSPDCPATKASEPYGLWGAALTQGDGSTVKYGFGGFVPDMTLPAARDLYWDLQRRQLFELGADGLKVDETDDFAAGRSLTQKFPGGIACNAYHNLMGTLTCNLVHERVRRDYDRRTFLFSRGNWAGMQRWATSAYTDFYGFRQFVMSVIVQSFSGSYYTPEIRNKETPDDLDYMRRAQMMFLTPFAMSNEWQDPAAVTRRSKAVLENYLKYDRLHYRLIPYVYSLFREQNRTGLGVVRALPFEFPDDPKAYEASDSFLLGPSLFVHPVAPANRSGVERFYLPAGSEWVDFWSHKVYAGGAEVAYPCAADVLPLLLRRGAIIPMGHFGLNTGVRTSPDVDLLVVPDDKETSFTLYEDDGISFAYEKGVYRETRVSARAKGETVTVTIAKPTGSFKVPPRKWNLRILHRGTEVVRAVEDSGGEQVIVIRP